jgi:hypothetical protein
MKRWISRLFLTRRRLLLRRFQNNKCWASTPKRKKGKTEMKTKLIVVMAALLLATQPWNLTKATVFIDLDFSGDTAKNSGSIGDGRVGIYQSSGAYDGPGLGTWGNVNDTGYPAGRAYSTGAEGSGTAGKTGAGTISWANATFLNGSGTLTFYAWIKPDTLMDYSDRIWNDGSGQNNVLIQTAGDGTMRMNVTIGGVVTANSLSFGQIADSPLGTNSIDNWVFIGVTYDSVAGTVVGVAGLAGDDSLMTVNKTNYYAGELANLTYNFTLLNANATPGNNRPFSGALGGFYLSNETLDFNSVFEAQKSNFIAIVPEASTISMLLGGGALLYLLNRRKRRVS